MDELRPLTKPEAESWTYAELRNARKEVMLLTVTLRVTMETLRNLMVDYEFYEPEYQDLENEIEENKKLFNMLCKDMTIIEAELIEREESAVVQTRKNGVNIYYSLN